MNLERVKNFFHLKNNKIFDGYIRILSGHTTASFFSFLLNYIAAAKLGPSLWGFWQQAVIVQRSLNLSNLGTADYLTRELALKDDNIARSNSEDSNITSSLLLSFFVLLLFNSLIFFNLSSFEGNIFIPIIMIMSFSTMISIFSGNILVSMQSNNQLEPLVIASPLIADKI